MLAIKPEADAAKEETLVVLMNKYIYPNFGGERIIYNSELKTK